MNKNLTTDLILVRHGESVGNLAVRASKRGDDSYYTKEFREQHSSQFHLTDLGREQAVIAGKWIRENIGETFSQYLVSPYVRTMQTAALLGLLNARWRQALVLREMDYGAIEMMTQKEKHEMYPENIARARFNGIFWTPPDGESIATLAAVRVPEFLDFISRPGSPDRSCARDSERVVVVPHGGFMDASRFFFEGMTLAEYHKFSDDPFDRMFNCQILHYSRRHPETGEVDTDSEYFSWVRSVSPTDPPPVKWEWRKIVPKLYSNEELLADAELLRGMRLSGEDHT